MKINSIFSVFTIAITVSLCTGCSSTGVIDEPLFNPKHAFLAATKISPEYLQIIDETNVELYAPLVISKPVDKSELELERIKSNLKKRAEQFDLNTNYQINHPIGIFYDGSKDTHGNYVIMFDDLFLYVMSRYYRGVLNVEFPENFRQVAIKKEKINLKVGTEVYASLIFKIQDFKLEDKQAQARLWAENPGKPKIATSFGFSNLTPDNKVYPYFNEPKYKIRYIDYGSGELGYKYYQTLDRLYTVVTGLVIYSEPGEESYDYTLFDSRAIH